MCYQHTARNATNQLIKTPTIQITAKNIHAAQNLLHHEKSYLKHTR